MYNNDMNNNQNFNDNQRPLFENDFVNSMSNVNSQDAFNPNYENFQTQFSSPYQIPPNFQNQQVSQTNVFENSFNQMSAQMNSNFQGMTNYDFQQPTGDIPPELGEIKNLSDATIANAPTMDVLDPMNIMPETINNNDPLDNYENGNLDNFNSFSYGVSENTNFNNNNNQNMNSNFSTPFINSNFSNNEYNFNNNQNIPSYQNSIPVVNQFDANLNNVKQAPSFNNNNFSNETAMIQTQSNNIPLDENIAKTMDTSYSNPITNSMLEEPSYIKNNITSELDGTMENQINNTEESSYSIVENKIGDSEEYNSNIVKNKISNNEEYENSTAENQTNNTDELNDYTIVQTSDLNKDEENMSLSDLGIEDSYNEPDTLDILDVDEKEKEQPQEISEKPESISENVDKIKKLIEELKSSGVNIDLEEFDFEEMYQLIIKINK